MIKAIVFDCFGVLVSDGWLPFREKYFSHDADLLEKAIASNKRMDAGLHTYEDFLHNISELSGVEYAETKRLIETNLPNEAIFTYITDHLKAKYKIGMLSNSGVNWLERLFTGEQLALFDETVLSYQIGVIKPDPVAYNTIADKLGVLPEECVFIDDQPRYADGAIRVGMKAIHYTDNKRLFEELAKVLGA